LSANEFLAWRWLKPVLDARQLREPDSRPLYKYNLSPAEVSSLERTLREAFQTPLPQVPRVIGAAFCLWTAHWFQREFAGGY
jgi:hypothetical protein